MRKEKQELSTEAEVVNEFDLKSLYLFLFYDGEEYCITSGKFAPLNYAQAYRIKSFGKSEVKSEEMILGREYTIRVEIVTILVVEKPNTDSECVIYLKDSGVEIK